MKRMGRLVVAACASAVWLVASGCTCAERSIVSEGGGSSVGSGSSASTGAPPPDVPEGCHPEDYGECDPWCQDCPEGEKCLPTPMPNSEWGPTRCVPVDPNGGPPGSECSEVVQSDPLYFSGVDDCGEGAACTGYLGDAYGCQPYCRGTAVQPECTFYHPMSVCRLLDPADPLPTCTDPCAPMGVDVPGRARCPTYGKWNCTVTSTATEEIGTPELVTELPMGAGHTMRCTPYVLHTTTEAGSPCGGGYESWMCPRGLVCVAASLVPYCKSPDAAEGCCAVYCDLAAPECPDGSVCRPLLAARPEYADYANLGVCASP